MHLILNSSQILMLHEIVFKDNEERKWNPANSFLRKDYKQRLAFTYKIQ